MAWTQRLPKLVPGLGSPFQNDTLFQSVATALTGTSAQTTSLTGLTPTVSCGYVRVKIYGGGGTSPLVTVLSLFVTDGTTYVLIGAPTGGGLTMSTTATTGGTYTNGGSLTAPGGLDYVVPFMVDISANQFSVITTMTGTSPTAKLDMEISGTS
jgi:hypothetical protein